MSRHLGLVAARLHAVLVTRPGSDVFHVYAGPLTRTGRFVPRAARSVCSARTRQLHVVPREGASVAMGSRRLCGRCEARLSAIARRASQPVSRDACLGFYTGITLADLVVAVALSESVDDTHRIGFVLSLLFGPAPVLRPRDPRPGDDTYRVRVRQAMFDLNAELLLRRRAFANAERTPEEIEIAARKREDDLARDQQIYAARRNAAAMDRAIDRRNNSQYLMPHERELLDSA